MLLLQLPRRQARLVHLIPNAPQLIEQIQDPIKNVKYAQRITVFDRTKSPQATDGLHVYLTGINPLKDRIKHIRSSEINL